MSVSDDEQSGKPLFEGLSDSTSPPLSFQRRKHDAPTAEEKKSSKRRKLKKPKDVQDEALDEDLGVNHAITHMDSRLMADHIAQRTKRFQPELSLIEAEALHIPDKAILDTTTWEKPRTKEHLADFLRQFAKSRRQKKGPTLSHAPQENGHPHTLVVAGSGLRAAELRRDLREFQTKEALVAKLFAKHIKFKDAVETVKKARINIGVGTPQRIFDLLENGALSATHLERVVVDASHIDQKKRGIMDMKETHGPLVQLLARKDIKDAAGGEIQFLFF